LDLSEIWPSKGGEKIMNLHISVETEILRVVVSGDFILEEAENDFLRILEAVKQHQLRKVLFDGAEIRGKPSTLERFFYGKFVADAATSHFDLYGVQFAYVLKLPVLDPGRFGETVAVNRGMFVKAFDNHEDALQWLV
jgi:hypothetical protein